MNYKYAAELAALPLTVVQCPCQEATARTGRAYRLVSLPADGEQNFLPQTLVMKVPRKIKVITPNLTEPEVRRIENNRCDDWAISLHTDPAPSRTTCKKFKLPYTHIAEIQLENEHGVCTPLDQNQHFNLHEAAGVDLRTAITDVQPL